MGFFSGLLGPTGAWDPLLSSLSPASYLGLSLQPRFLGLLNSLKVFCTSSVYCWILSENTPPSLPSSLASHS